jgi:sec-independent protein translocase protein TatA
VINLFSNIGTPELIVIALLMLFLFGGRKLPELSRGVADSVKAFKEATKEKV